MKLLLRGMMSVLLVFAPIGQTFAYNVLHTSDGNEVRWFKSEVPYYINTDGFTDFDSDELIKATQGAFETWTSEQIGVTFRYMGTVDIKEAEDDCFNIIFFVQDPMTWKEMFKLEDDTALARTRTYASSYGEIVAFDLVFNDGRYQFTDTDIPEDVQTDYVNTLTHELGHVLGLDHSEDPDAVMYATSRAGELSKRRLAEDDREGIHYLYREPIPQEYGCNVSGETLCENKGMACNQAARSGRTGQCALSLLLLVVPAIWMRRRRTRFR